MQEAFKLRRQRQIHNQQRQREGHQYLAAGLLQLTRFAFPADLRVVRQAFACGFLRPRHRFAQRIALRQTRTQGNRAQAVEAVQGARFGHFFQRHQIR